ncbi:class I SAM-dependent methyltransferase [Candidatus Saccharibacteria bacterium]|nr:class I SAM-dependent methyltransferase [Candidatus Saccharibacteria bacterium]
MQQVSDKETEVLLELAERALGAPGELVEFGCYRGDTSLLLERLIERRAPEKRLWIYDSFEGLPEKSAEDASVAGDAFKAGELFVTKREVVERFKKAGLRVPKIRKGWFEDLNPETDVPEQICFAFLDGDLYRSIRVSLELVEGRVDKSGVIVVHDYNNPELPGVTRAVDEWLGAHKKAKLTVRASLAVIEP